MIKITLCTYTHCVQITNAYSMNKSKILLIAGVLLLIAGHFMREYSHTDTYIFTGKVLTLAGFALLAFGAYLGRKIKPAFIIIMLLTAIIFLLLTQFLGA